MKQMKIYILQEKTQNRKTIKQELCVANRNMTDDFRQQSGPLEMKGLVVERSMICNSDCNSRLIFYNKLNNDFSMRQLIITDQKTNTTIISTCYKIKEQEKH